MEIKQFKYSRDNFGYLVFSGQEALAIDAGAVGPMNQFARENQLKIKFVTNTHLHQDHTCGNPAMLEKTNAQFLDCKTLKAGQVIELAGESVEVIPTPGHTLDCISFAAGDFLVTGDTLFNGTVGNCFSGDLDAFFHSIKRLTAYPAKTKIYSGHDYVEDSMKYARIIEKENPHIDAYLKSYDPEKVVSTLDDEFKVNPYIRFNAPEIQDLLKQKNLPSSTEQERFKAMMEVY
ncbi:hydroxyacylglutathione hydrolase family protein [Desulfospira joergensenii]|uniref:hydroxyacylglutathione hydrolase family protein n=1 Tax=Desulfospira joergensenii TaxID=53329 RepID=UPI0003B783A9|nr:hydroxyacylglutathione hydrolase family protein [Desulfospira joergensenii]